MSYHIGSPGRTGASGHAGLMGWAGEVEQVGLAGALAGHAPFRMEAVVISLGAAPIDLARWTRPVCVTKDSSPVLLFHQWKSLWRQHAVWNAGSWSKYRQSTHQPQLLGTQVSRFDTVCEGDSRRASLSTRYMTASIPHQRNCSDTAAVWTALNSAFKTTTTTTATIILHKTFFLCSSLKKKQPNNQKCLTLTNKMKHKFSRGLIKTNYWGVNNLSFTFMYLFVVLIKKNTNFWLYFNSLPHSSHKLTPWTDTHLLFTMFVFFSLSILLLSALLWKCFTMNFTHYL